MTIEDEVGALADAEAIRNLARRYAHCVWQGDARGAADLFCEDGVMDTGDRDPLVGREVLFETYRAMFETTEFRPFVHNHVLELRGEGATGTCYLDLQAVVGGQRMTGFGYYDDEYARQDGVWLFRKRKLNLLRYEEAGAKPEGAV